MRLWRNRGRRRTHILRGVGNFELLEDDGYFPGIGATG